MEITQLSLPLHINVRVCWISNVVYTLNGNIVTLAGMSTLENLWMSKWQPSDSKVHGANMRPTWILLAPDGPHVCPMNLAIRVSSVTLNIVIMTCLLQYIDISWSVSLLLQRGHLSNNYTLCFSHWLPVSAGASNRWVGTRLWGSFKKLQELILWYYVKSWSLAFVC